MSAMCCCDLCVYMFFFSQTVSLCISVHVMKCARVTDCMQTWADTYILNAVKKKQNSLPHCYCTGSYCSLIKPTDFRVKIGFGCLRLLLLNHN